MEEVEYTPNTMTKIQNMFQNTGYFHIVIVLLIFILSTMANDIGSLLVLGVWILIYFAIGFDVPSQVDEILLKKEYAWDELSGYYIKDGQKFKIDEWSIKNNRVSIRLKEYRDDFVVV